MPTSSEIQLIITAQDRATAVLKKTEGSVSKLTGVIKGLAIGAGALYAGKKIVDFAGDSIKAFRSAEVSAAKVDTILKTLGKTGEQAAGKIEELSQAAIKLGFDDEDAAESLAKLLQVTGDMTKAQESNALAMDIARGKNIELSDATRLVTLIHAGNFRELKQLGIELDENATKTDALRIVQERYSGQAASFAQTGAGQALVLANSWENVQEKIGGALNKGLQPFYSKLIEFIGRKDVQESITKLAEAIGNGLGKALEFVTRNAGAFKTGFNAVAATANFIIGIFKALQKALENVFYYMFRAIDQAKSAWNALKSSISSAADTIKSKWDSLRSSLSKPVDAIVKITEKISGKSGDKKALGGPVMTGQAYIVGENRPEVFVPHQSGNIRQTNEVGGGKIEVNFNNPSVRSDYDLQELVRTVRETIERSQRMERHGVRTI